MSQSGIINVEGSGSGPIETLSGENGTHEPPVGGNFNFSGSIAGGSAANGAVLFSSTGAGEMDVAVQVDNSTIIINASNQLQATGSYFNYTAISFADSPYTVLSTDYYISVDSSGGLVVINFPNAPTAKRSWVVKDRTGNASNPNNNIQLTTPGGVVTFDGQTTYTIYANYASVNVLANSTPTYEVY